MRRITLALIAIMLTGGVAAADRDHRDRSWRGRDRGHERVRDHSRHQGDVVVRDHRGHSWRDGHRDRVRQRVRIDRRPVYVNNGRFVFHNGYTRTYSRPVIRHRYYDYRYRPQIIVENYDPVPGYIWVQGKWNWNGYEWIWTSGYWAVDPNYQYNYYDPYDGRYYNSY